MSFIMKDRNFLFCLFFFFKQKTAYEIGTGDWSSDVCSSDLTISRIEGLDFDGLAKEVLVRHKAAFAPDTTSPETLEVGGVYQWKHRGEKHLFGQIGRASCRERV